MDEKPNYYAIIPADVRYDKDLRANEKLLYGEITALTKKTGECWASNSYFSELYGVKPNAIATWIRHLKNKGYIAVGYTYNGKEITKRLITIGGIQKDNTSYPNEYGGGIQKDNRGGIQKGEENNTSITNNTSINKRKYIKESFETLWKLYPNKKGKLEAYKKFEKAIKEGVAVETIQEGIEKYNAYIQAERIKPQYIKHGSTWFNQRCWDDDYTITRKPTTKDIAEKIDFMNFLKENDND